MYYSESLQHLDIIANLAFRELVLHNHDQKHDHYESTTRPKKSSFDNLWVVSCFTFIQKLIIMLCAASYC